MKTSDKSTFCQRTKNVVQVAVRPASTDNKRYREPIYSKPVKFPTLAAARDFEHVFNEMFG